MLSLRRQFSIRWLFFVTTLIAFAIVVYTNWPSQYVRVTLHKSGEISINGVKASKSEITNKVKTAIGLRQYWFEDTFAIISVPAGEIRPEIVEEDWFDAVMRSRVNAFEVVALESEN